LKKLAGITIFLIMTMISALPASAGAAGNADDPTILHHQNWWIMGVVALLVLASWIAIGALVLNEVFFHPTRKLLFLTLALLSVVSLGGVALWGRTTTLTDVGKMDKALDYCGSKYRGQPLGKNSPYITCLDDYKAGINHK
jgi:hypothetical protein